MCNNRALIGGANPVLDWQSADTIAILEGAKGLQFQYSKDGYVWMDSPTSSSERDKIRHIKIELAAVSKRESSIKTPTDSLEIGNAKIHREEGFLSFCITYCRR